MPQGTIIKITGPVIVAEGMAGAAINHIVHIGGDNIPGEIINVRGNRASIQVYGETKNLAPGMPVRVGEEALSVYLAPGLLGSTLDGIGQPPVVDMKWRFEPAVAPGAELSSGDIWATVRETPEILNKIMLPPGIHGAVLWVAPEGEYGLHETVLKLETEGGQISLPIGSKWPVRKPRPIAERTVSKIPMPTGWRAIDTFFPIYRGGVAAIVGPFGSGKTVIQQRILSCADADVVVHVACGMRDHEIPEIPSNNALRIVVPPDAPAPFMEASIYTAMAISEYYRDMGYRVALLVDSMSRWAEALSEISQSLGETPCESGCPPYLDSRIAAFFERSGCALCLGGQTGSITTVAAASLPDGGLLEPPLTAMLTAAQTRIRLSADLASRRQFPAISFSESDAKYADHNGHGEALNLLKDAAPSDLLMLLAGRMLEEDFMLEEILSMPDSPTPDAKRLRMLSLILKFLALGREALAEGADFSKIASLPALSSIARLKYIPDDEPGDFDAIENELARQMDDLAKEGENHD